MSKDKIYTKQYKITHYDADPYGNVKPSSLMNYLQDASGHHAKQWGISVFDLFSQGKSWVISRYNLRIYNRPAIGNDITVSTWPSIVQKSFVLREFEAIGTGGELIAQATISVAMIDFKTKKLVPIDSTFTKDYLTPKRVISEEFDRLPEVQQVEREIVLPVMIRDLDANMHVNHVVYGQWALESVPLQTWNSHHLAGVEINYKREVRHGGAVKVICEPIEVSKQKKQYAHQLYDAQTSKEVARIRTTWSVK